MRSAAEPLEPRPAWWKPAFWLPLIGLVLFLAGLWRLVPGPGVFDGFPVADSTLPTVVVDAGHGGKDGGAAVNGLREKDLTLDTALRIERHLRRRGFPVVMTRRDDRFVGLEDRAKVANKIPRALFVSIHYNTSPTAEGEGIETFYAERKVQFDDSAWSFSGMFRRRPDPPPEDQGAGFAHAVQANIVAALGAVDRGAKPRQFAVVRLTRCAAVLVEGGFINNPAEGKKVAGAPYRERLAVAVAAGVAEYHAQQMAAGGGTRVVDAGR